MMHPHSDTRRVRTKEGRSSQPGEARIGPISSLPQLLKELGVSPRLALKEAGIPVTVFDNPENRLSYESFGRMLMVCTEQTRRADFGLLLGSKFQLEGFGDLGELMRMSATVREALRVLILNLRYYDRFAFSYLLQPGPDQVLLGYSFEQPAVRSAPVFYDLVTTIAFRILREVCGPAWNATLVQISHGNPENSTSYRRILGPNVRFDQEISGVLFRSSWLERTMPDADTPKWHALNRKIQSKQSRLPLSFSEEVLRVLHQMLPTGKTSSGDIANLFDISERTLRHRLSNEGTSLQCLVAGTRHQLACHLLLNTNLPISKIATNLGFTDSSVFSRAFRNWEELSPRQWRNVNNEG